MTVLSPLWAMCRSTDLCKTESRSRVKWDSTLTRETPNHVFQASEIGLFPPTPSRTNPCTPKNPWGTPLAASRTHRCGGRAASPRGQLSGGHLFPQRSVDTKSWDTGKRKSKGETKITSGTIAEKIWLRIDLDTTGDSFPKIKWKRFWATKEARMRSTTPLWVAHRRQSWFSKLRGMHGQLAPAAISVPPRNPQIFN